MFKLGILFFGKLFMIHINKRFKMSFGLRKSEGRNKWKGSNVFRMLG